jgi:hypothetical protein
MIIDFSNDELSIIKLQLELRMHTMREWGHPDLLEEKLYKDLEFISNKIKKYTSDTNE